MTMSQSLHLLSRRSLSLLSSKPTIASRRTTLLNLKPTGYISTKYFTTDDDSSSSTSKPPSSSSKPSQPQKNKRTKKDNFAKKFLDPASKGELNKNHSSGIPKLAVRKAKGHGIKDDFPGKQSDEILNDDIGGAATTATATATGGVDNLQSVVENFASKRGQGKQQQQNTRTTAMRKHNQRKEDVSHLFEGPKPHELNPSLNPVTFLAEGGNGASVSTNTSIRTRLIQQQRNLKQKGGQQQNQRGGGGGFNQRGGGGRGDRAPIDIWGDEILESEAENPWPTPYMAYTYHNPHDESKREAKPITFPTNRINPPLEFIEKHNSFAYVTNVPRPVFDNVLGQFDNPLHRHEVSEIVANALNVPVEHVFTSTMTSAFVGFADTKSASDSYNKSESKRIIQNKIEYSIYSTNAEDEDEDVKKFVSSAPSPDSIVQLTNIPGGMTNGTIVRILHNLIKLNMEDVQFINPTTVLFKTKSSSDAKEFINNTQFVNLIKQLSRQILRVQPANLEVVFDKYDGPARQFPLKKKTNNLLVNGDLPSNKFFLSHGAVLHLCNVPPSITKEEITAFFQPFCVQRRDMNGSIEIIKSIDGHPTGRVYVGFDLASELDRAWESISDSAGRGSTTIMLNEAGPPIRVKPVQEKNLIRGTKLGERTERTQEELIECLHMSWQDHVDPKDIELLESFGVSKDVLEDAFMSARFNNPSFSYEDLAREGERLHGDKAPGQEYSDFVKLYVETLKEVASTRENPGILYESMFLPQEEMDFSLFDEEEERLAKLREEREKMV